MAVGPSPIPIPNLNFSDSGPMLNDVRTGDKFVNFGGGDFWSDVRPALTSARYGANQYTNLLTMAAVAVAAGIVVYAVKR